MKVMLASRAAPLLITTMLISVPAWAQSTLPQSSPPPTVPDSQAPASAMPANPDAAGPQAAAPSGTMHKGMQQSARRGANVQPGETMQTLVERRIADLHTRLHITPEQGQQWDQFAQAMRENAKDLDQRFEQRSQTLGTMSAVDNMKSFAEIEQVRAQDMEKLVPAFQTLYGSLSDQQKKMADQLFRNYAMREQAHRQAAAAK